MCAVVEEVGGSSGTLSGGNWIVEHFVNCGLGIDWRFNAGLLRVWVGGWSRAGLGRVFEGGGAE